MFSSNRELLVTTDYFLSRNRGSYWAVKTATVENEVQHNHKQGGTTPLQIYAFDALNIYSESPTRKGSADVAPS